MPKIYVANTMLGPVELNYRTPTEKSAKTGKMMWSDRLRVERIPAGGQITLGNGADFTDFEAHHIFEHHASHFGAKRGNQYAKGFVGLIFDDKEIDLERIEEAMQQNKDAAEDRSNNILNATAQAMLEKQIDKARAADSALPKRVELEMAAETSKDIDVGGKGAEATLPGVAPRNRGQKGVSF